jgi:hypothetical protein
VYSELPRRSRLDFKLKHDLVLGAARFYSERVSVWTKQVTLLSLVLNLGGTGKSTSVKMVHSPRLQGVCNAFMEFDVLVAASFF